MMHLHYTGTIEVRPFGDGVQPSLFLGRPVPLCADLYQRSSKVTHQEADVRLVLYPEAGKPMVYSGIGKLSVDARTYSTCAFDSLQSIEHFRIGRTDMLARLKAHAGKRAELRITLR